MSYTDNPEKLVKGTAKTFLASFGEGALHLACHAAVPVVLSPELLHLLRVNFFLDTPEPLPYMVESDILLSPLCNEIGDNLYEIPPDIRDILLRELATTPAYGEQRIHEIAALLFQYSKRFSPWQNNQTLERGQQLTAFNFLDSQSAKKWLEASEEDSHSAALSEREWFIAMRAELLKLDAVFSEPQDFKTNATGELETPFTEAPVHTIEPLQFPFNQRPFSRYEPIEKRVEDARVLIIDDLLRNEDDISDVARREWGRNIPNELQRERRVAALDIETIHNNISRLVKRPTIHVGHLSEIAEAARKFRPNAIILSGTVRDFDFYKPELIESFGSFIRTTTIPVLAIGGGHQLVGLSFGARVLTLDYLEPRERREKRQFEYQYRFMRITDPEDPIFHGINDESTGIWEDYTTGPRIIRAWQNHGLQLDRVPEGFKLLVTSYLCRNQMMVKRTDGQLIYTTQFHPEKSFEDWNKNRTRWEHQNESRDGRILFENFLIQALAHRV
ncbi:MAG TPA: hypothetical protein VF544_18140 [Pyrinomonadaceae bacterium]|jgi:GMP synthase-like glutamine amidotransferase